MKAHLCGIRNIIKVFFYKSGSKQQMNSFFCLSRNGLSSIQHGGLQLDVYTFDHHIILVIYHFKMCCANKTSLDQSEFLSSETSWSAKKEGDDGQSRENDQGLPIRVLKANPM
jgi:hypothetical protein